MLLCSVCSEPRPADQFALNREQVSQPDLICSRCWYAKKEEQERSRLGHEILKELEPWMAGHLERVGLSRREIKAELARVPDVIRRSMPKEPLRELMAGNTPSRGFGLGGNTDGGKTMALAAILRAHLGAWAQCELPARGRVMPDWFRWSSWPDEVNWLRSHAIDGNGAERIEELATVRLLFLDDLGRERIKGSYSDDWAASQLDTIVNRRYREEKVTIWTTNVKEVDLVNLYGAAMVRRLTADNPLIWMELGSAR
jgi:hypothetical protein